MIIELLISGMIGVVVTWGLTFISILTFNEMGPL